MPRWRSYTAVGQLSFQTTVAHRGQVSLQAAGSLCWVAATFAVWRYVFDHGAEPGGYTWDEFVIYLLVNATMAMVAASDAGFAERLVTGRIAVDLNRPMSLAGMRAAIGIGEATVGAVLALPMWLAAGLLVAGGLALDGMQAFALALSLVLAVVLKTLIVQTWSLACIWTDDAYSVAKLRIALIALLSGAIVPLSMWPEPLDEIAAATPFAALVQTPFDIATGGDAAALLALQLFWCGAVVALSILLWRWGSERLNVHGG